MTYQNQGSQRGRLALHGASEGGRAPSAPGPAEQNRGGFNPYHDEPGPHTGDGSRARRCSHLPAPCILLPPFFPLVEEVVVVRLW